MDFISILGKLALAIIKYTKDQIRSSEKIIRITEVTDLVPEAMLEKTAICSLPKKFI